MKIDKICELDSIDFKITRNKTLRYRKSGNKQFKIAYIHNECKQCGSMYVSSNKNAIYCCNDCSKFNDTTIKEEYNNKKNQKEKSIKQSKIFCKLCNHQVLNSLHLSHHLVTEHKYNKIGLQKYYDKHFKIKAEGLCIICESKTKYDTFVKGYDDICGQVC